MKKIVLSLVVISAILIGGVWGWNFATLQDPIDQALLKDPRNKGIVVKVHYDSYIDPTIIVFDLQSVSATNSAADVSRTLLQSSSALKEVQLQSVVLAFKGQNRFSLSGSYFSTLGREYGTQNPVYTLRTLPENVRNIDGSPAFATWTGGMLGVVGKQMDDLNEFHRRWWLSDSLRQAN